MNRPKKEKRTKEEMLSLLDRAMEQEELQANKIEALELELLECRKKAEDPRAELNETAFPASKTSFRIDYYRPAESSPIKGIVEHLASRSTFSFNGDGFEEVARFIAQFMPHNSPTAAPSKQKAPAAHALKSAAAASADHTPASAEPIPSSPKAVFSPLLHKLMPDLFPGQPPAPAESEEIMHAPANRMKGEAFSIMEQGEHAHTGSVHKSKPFKIEIPGGELLEFHNKNCYLRLHLESLETGNTFIINDTCVPKKDMPIVTHKPLLLQEAGAYRITVMLTQADDPRSTYYRESRLLVVV